MFLALVECREHDGEDGRSIISDEIQDVLIIPEVQSPLSHLRIVKGEGMWSTIALEATERKHELTKQCTMHCHLACSLLEFKPKVVFFFFNLFRNDL